MSEQKITEATTNTTPLDTPSKISVSAEPAVASLKTEFQELNEEKEALERELQEVIIPIRLTYAYTYLETFLSTPKNLNHNSQSHPSIVWNARCALL